MPGEVSSLVFKQQHSALYLALRGALPQCRADQGPQGERRAPHYLLCRSWWESVERELLRLGQGWAKAGPSLSHLVLTRWSKHRLPDTGSVGSLPVSQIFSLTSVSA